MIKFWLVVFSLLLASGCKNGHEINILSSEPFNLIISDPVADDRFGTVYINRKIIVQPGTNMHSLFLNWVNDNKTGWDTSFASYAPGNVFVEGSTYSFNFNKGLVVLAYRRKSYDSVQLVKSVDPNSYSFLFD